MLLKNKGCKEERMTKVGLYAIDKSTTLESNKSHLGFFEFVHNVRKRGKALLGALIELLVT
jgi:hypothetical protein